MLPHCNADNFQVFIITFQNKIQKNLKFILVTKTNKVIVVETKGSDRDNSDSASKLRLGKAWEKCAGSTKFKYFMIFDRNAIDGAFNLEEGITRIKQL